jgi:hypothetical protein
VVLILDNDAAVGGHTSDARLLKDGARDSMMADNSDDERPATESTPLILRRSTVHTQLPSRSLPPLTPVVNRIRLHGIQTVDEDPSLFPSHRASLSQQIAFKIIVLSQLCILAKTPSMGVRTDVWEQWSGERAASLDAEDLQRRIIHVWEEFLEVSRSTQEIEECLWSRIALEEDKFHTVRGMFLISCTRRAISLSFFLPHLSRRYLEGSQRASCFRISSSNHAEPVSHLDAWKGRHSCQFLLPP